MKDFTIRPIWALVVLATTLLLLTLAGFAYTRQVQHTTAELKRTQADLKATIATLQVTRRDVLCPFYGLILGLYDPDSPEARQDPKRYEANFEVFRVGARLLNCPPVR